MLYDFFDNVKINLPKGFLLDDGEVSSVDKNLNVNGTFTMADLRDDDGDLCDFKEWFNIIIGALADRFDVLISSPTVLNTQYKTGFVAFPIHREVQGTVARLLVLVGAVQVDDENAILFSGNTGWRAGDEEGNLDRFSALIKVFKGITVDETKITLNSFTPAKIMKKYINEEDMLNGVNEIETKAAFSEIDENDVNLKPFDFSSKNAKTFDNNLIIPVPEGFAAYENQGYIGYQEELIIVTEDYDDLTNYFDAPFVLTVQKLPINIGNGKVNRQTVDFYESVLRKANGFVSDATVFRFGLRDGFIAFAQSLVDFDEPTYNKLRSFVCTDNGIYQCSFTYNHSYDASDESVIDRFIAQASRWLEAIRVVGEKDFGSFPNAFADSELYSFYEQTMSMKKNALPGVVVRTSGFAYSFVPLVEEIQNRGFSLDSKDAEKQIFGLLGNADSEYTLWQEAEKMTPIFRVSKTAFDFKHDKECALKEGLAREAHMMSALRSFAWILSAYCNENNLKPEEVQLDDILEIIDCAERRNWLSYNDSSYCRGLCGCDDINVAYTPESISPIILLGFMGEFTRTHSLEELRKDLEYIAPAIRCLYLHLLDGRDRDSVLDGNEADILYMWCALAMAAKSSFFVDNGPGVRVFEQLTDDIEEYRPGCEMGNQYTSDDSTNSKRAKARKEKIKNSDIALYEDNESEYYFAEEDRYCVQLDECEMDGDKLIKFTATTDKPCIVFPKGIRVIGDNAITAEAAKAIVFSEGLGEAEMTHNCLFENSNEVEYLYLPSTFKAPPYFHPFWTLNPGYYTSLKYFDVAKDNANCTSINGVLYDRSQKDRAYLLEAPAAIKEILITKDVAKIREGAFRYCNSIEKIQVEEGNKRYKCIDGMLCEIKDDKTHLMLVPTTVSGEFICPKGINVLDSKCFINLDDITKVVLSEEVERVEDSAFGYHPENLKVIDVPSPSTIIDENAIHFFKYYEVWTVQCMEGSEADKTARKMGWNVDNAPYEEKTRKWREEQELIKLEVERKAREEAERKAREEEERKAREEEERKAKEEAERKEREKERRKAAREEAKRKAREEEERKAREEAERKAREEAERLEQERIRAERRAKKLCQHCGGTFKGLFTKKCSNCGEKKDY